MRQVFISYSSKDYAQALTVRNVLEQNGITCWMAPESIPGGSNYTKEIPIAIRECQAFVLMLSNNAQDSHWVLKELDRAVNEGKIILPFQLEDVPLSDEFNFLLTGAQRYDAYQKKTEALKLLVSRIKAIVDANPQPAEEPVQPEPQPQPQPEKKKVEIPIPVKMKKEAPKQTFSSSACPACGSLDVTEFPDQVKPREPMERILCIVAGIGMAVAGLLISGIASTILADFLYFDLDMDYDVMDMIYGLMPLIMIAGAAVGGWLSTRVMGNWMRRQRIRKHIKVTECRCNTCQKKFQAVENQ